MKYNSKYLSKESRCIMIDVKNLSISYKDIKAVDDITFSVEEGEIFGMIGANGAGKTSTIECIEGLRKPDAGIIQVLGFNPQQERDKLYHLIGVQLQETSYQDRIKVKELCQLFSSLYENPLAYEDLLVKFELADKKQAYVSKLSGGQRQKLSLILALIPNPKIVFFDEITTGLDPKARHVMWDLIKGLKKDGITIFMTTHFMDEAETLCDRIAIMNKGKIEAVGNVEQLIDQYEIEEKVLFLSDMTDLESLKSITGVSNVLKQNNEVCIWGIGHNILGDIVKYLHEEGIVYSDMKHVRPNLEDVFLKLTGYKMDN